MRKGQVCVLLRLRRAAPTSRQKYRSHARRGRFQKLSQDRGNSRKSGTVRGDTADGALTPPSPRERWLCNSGLLQVPSPFGKGLG